MTIKAGPNAVRTVLERDRNRYARRVNNERYPPYAQRFFARILETVNEQLAAMNATETPTPEPQVENEKESNQEEETPQ